MKLNKVAVSLVLGAFLAMGVVANAENTYDAQDTQTDHLYVSRTLELDGSSGSMDLERASAFTYPKRLELNLVNKTGNPIHVTFPALHTSVLVPASGTRTHWLELGQFGVHNEIEYKAEAIITPPVKEISNESIRYILETSYVPDLTVYRHVEGNTRTDAGAGAPMSEDKTIRGYW